ncbi:MAG TPA: glycosyltransferase family 39 protein, partial [Casimicrobiaceae bacterium]|nr:glycosyltransferase family 39 protein [Casimicrobiaceae bacterium]
VVAAHVADFGAWHYDVQRNVAAVTPLLVDFLYAAGYMAGGEVAARLVNVGTLLVTLAGVHAAVRSVASRRVALLATLLAAASPLVALESASLFIDNGWALFVVASLVALLRFAKGGEPVHFVAGGIAFGAALASKAITVAALPAAALLVGLAWHDRRRAFPWRTLAGAVVAGLAVALPPYVIAFAKTGNPVFPLFNAVFRSPLFPPRSAILYPAEADPALLYRMTFYSDRYLEAYPGALGFTLLLLLPAMIAAAARWGRRDGRAMLFAAIAFAAFVVANTAYLRYVYPSLFLFAIAVGTTLPALDRSDALLGGAFKLTALGGVVVSALFLPAAFAPLRTFDLRAIHDAGARDAFVTAWAPTRQFVPLLNAMPAERGAVAFLGAQPYLAQITRPAYTDVAYQRGFLDAGAALRTEADLLRLIRDFELGFLVVDARRLPRLPALVHGATLPLARAGDVTLFEVTPHARYQVEHLPDDGFDASPGGWVPTGEPARSGAAVVVNGASALYRPVAVQAGAAYRYAVDARCHDVPAELRLQVLWQLPGGGTKVDARAVPCTPHWSEASDVLVAPPGTSMAVVYATGHAAAPVEIRRVSFRSKR